MNGMVMTKLKLNTFAVCLTLATTPVFAQTDADEAAFGAVVTQYTEALEAGNMGASMDVLPPVLLQTIAETAGVDKDQLLEGMRAQAEAMGDSMVFSDINFDQDAIEWKTAESGKDYALIQGSSVLEMTDPSTDTTVKMKRSGTYLGMSDGGEWYMIEISDPQQQALFDAAYPDYAGITVPAGTMETVE